MSKGAKRLFVPDDDRRGVDARDGEWPDGNFGHNCRWKHPDDLSFYWGWPVFLDCVAK